MDRSVFLTAGSAGVLPVCVTNTNLFSDPTQSLVPEDRFDFRLPPGCASDFIAGSCVVSVGISQAPSPLVDSDFTCTVADGKTVELEYDGGGASKEFLPEDFFCIDVALTAPSQGIPASCALAYRFTPRASAFGTSPTIPADGVNRISQPQVPSFFTLDWIDPIGEKGDPGPAGPPGSAGGLTGYEVMPGTGSGAGSTGACIACCSTGKKVLGGGSAAVSGVVEKSHPTMCGAPNDQPVLVIGDDAWRTTIAFSTGGGHTCWAICANPP